MLSMVLKGARCAAIGMCAACAMPSGAVNLVATSSNLDATLSRMASGDTLSLAGTFGELRMTNRTFAKTVTIDASHAVFTTTMVFDNVRGIALSGGTFNIAGNGAYAKGIAVYNGANVYIDGVTVIGSADGTIDQFGVAVNGTNNAQVTNSNFSGLYSGIGYGSVVGGFIAKNTFTAATSDGIDIADSHGVTAVVNKCSGGRPGPGSHPDCIQMWSVAGKPLESDIVVSNNTAYGPTQGFTNFDAGLRITITNNTVMSTYSAGVACYSCIDSNISYNTISTLPGAPYQSHVSIAGGINNTVIGNVVAPYVEPPHSSIGAVGDGLLLGSYDEPAFSLDVLRPTGGNTGLAPWMSSNRAALSESEIGAVPEPSTWGLLISGFAAVGIARRRTLMKVGRSTTVR